MITHDSSSALLADMSIRFSCPHCSQKLSVSTRKSGAKSKCPRCKQELQIPQAPPDKNVAAEPGGLEKSGGADPADDHFSQFAIFDETELIYEDDDDDSAISAPRGSPHLDRVAVPRYVLYTQGALLGIVGLVCFVFGVLTGGTFFTTPQAALQAPCKLTGVVTFGSGARILPDVGAVVIVFPKAREVGPRVNSLAMRPDQPLTEGVPPGIQQIRDLGGGYARVDSKGMFQIHLPSGGEYYVLVLSSHVKQRSENDVKTPDILTVGRYLDGATELLSAGRYQLTSEKLAGDRRFNAVFD